MRFKYRRLKQSVLLVGSRGRDKARRACVCGHKLFAHLCLLFIVFLKAGYLPRDFVQAVVVPLVKCKTGNLADTNNYRAIAISNALSKLFESVIAKQVFTYADCEKHQFGFKAHHSTGICTQVF